MNLSKTRLVIVGAEQAGRGAAKALRASQPITATRNMAPEANEYEAPPWFWSDPHDAGIQIVCHPGGGGEIVRGDITNGRFTTLIGNNEAGGRTSIYATLDLFAPRLMVVAKDDPSISKISPGLIGLPHRKETP